MAIYNSVPPPPEDEQSHIPPTETQVPLTPSVNNTGIDIEAWTISALQSLNVSPVARGTGTALTIPLDEYVRPRSTKTTTVETDAAPNKEPHAVRFDEKEPLPPRRPPSRRDSLARREALLKGKEGSRQRRRWENDRLIGVPNAQPPQPSDWEVQPTHPTHRVPYQIAQYWDRGVRDRVQDKTKRLQAARKQQQLICGSATGLGVGEVPRDLRESAKRTPAVKDWVRTLEEPVRQFMRDQHALFTGSSASTIAVEDDSGEMDSDEEEIVFAGRSDAVRELREKRDRWRLAQREMVREAVDSGVVFDSFGEDESASFKRWLTHSISDYYGLASRSVTVGNSSQKIVYVGFKQTKRAIPFLPKLPRPLWEACG